MDSRHKSVPPLVPPKSPLVISKHLSQPNLLHHKTHQKRLDNLKSSRDQEDDLPKSTGIQEDEKESEMEIVEDFVSNQKSFDSSTFKVRRSSSLSRKKSQNDDPDQVVKNIKCTSTEVLNSKSKNFLPSPPVMSSCRFSLPCKLSKLSLNGNESCGEGPPEIRILINDEEPRQNFESTPRRPMKRKSQDYDRNFLSEHHSTSGSRQTSDFWLPKVKVTPSMVTQLNAEILANFQGTIMSESRDEQHHHRVIQLLYEFLSNNKFLSLDERITDAIETISTRILSPSDDEMWTILTSHQVINVQCSLGSLQMSPNFNILTNIKVVGYFSINQIKRILTDPDLSLAYLVGPNVEIVTGDSVKTEKLISSILVSALRCVQKFSGPGLLNEIILPETEKTQQEDLESQPMPSTSSTKSTNVNQRSGLNRPNFLEVSNVSTLEIPSISDAFKKIFPYEKQIFHCSAVVVQFEEISPDIEVPVRIQVADEGTEFRASILKLTGCTLTFCNPIRTFFTYNPSKKLCNIDVSNPEKFSVNRIESPKSNSLFVSHNEESFLIETGGPHLAEEIFQRVHSIQRMKNSVLMNGKQVAHIFITGQSLLALKIHSCENIFQIPLLNLVKLHKPINQPETCIMELESTEAMDFISSYSPCWSFTFATTGAKTKFLHCLHRVAPLLDPEQQ